MPKLLQINSCVNFSSTGKIVEQIGAVARNNGWETYVAHGARDNGPTDLVDLKTNNITTEYLHAFFSKVFDAHGLGSVFYTRKLVKKMDKIQPDVVHLHNIHGYFLNYPILFRYLSRKNIPIVWTFHDCWPVTGHCAYFDKVYCQKWKTHCHDCELISLYPSSFLDRSYHNFEIKKKYFTMPSNITLVPVSHWLDNILKQSYLNRYKSQVIHNGIDLSVFKPTYGNLVNKLNIKDKFVILGVAAKWGKEDRLNGFLELRKRLDHNYIIILIGLNKDQISKMPIGIIGVERTNSANELAEYYSMADVFANPTMQDNFPTTNLEALACGTPVITYRTGGSPEAIDETTGIVVDKADISQFEKAIKTVERLKNSGIFYSSEQCISRAHSLYNKFDRYNDYILLYNSLL